MASKSDLVKKRNAAGSLDEIADHLADESFGKSPGWCEFGRFISALQQAAPDQSALDLQFSGAIFLTYCGYTDHVPPPWFVLSLGIGYDVSGPVTGGVKLRKMVAERKAKRRCC